MESKQENVITVAPISVKEAEVAKTESETTLVEVREIVIIDNHMYEWAGNYLRTIKGKIDKITTLRKSMTKPLDESKRKIMDLFRKPLEMYEESINILDKSIIHYSDEQEKIRFETERKLQVEANRKREEAEKKAEEFRTKGKEEKAEQWEEKAETIVAPVLASTTPKLNGISYRSIWKYRVSEGSIIPREYLMPDEKMLSKFAIATKGKIPIAGIEFFVEKIVSKRKIENAPF